MQFQITENAFKRIKELKDKEQQTPIALRVSVDGGGCNGFMYKYEFVHEILPEDFVIKQDESIVIIDPISEAYLAGCTLDFVEQLGNSYFEIKNPNAKGKCGCGNSFSV